MNALFDNNIPIYIQIENLIKIKIISGELQANEKLATVREYASIFKVNPNTVQKAFSDLERENLVYTDSTNGRYVTDNQKIINKVKREYIKSITNDYITKMANINVNKDELINYLKEDE